MGKLPVSFSSVVKIAWGGGEGGGRKVKVAAKNVSGSRLESLHEELEGMTRHEETLPGSRTKKCISSVLSQLSSRQLFLSV